MAKIVKSGILILVFLAAFFASAVSTSAATADDLKQQIDQKNQEIQKLEEEIKQYQGSITSAQSTAKTLKEAIDRLNSEIKQLGAQINLTNNKVSKKELEIKELELNIGDTSASLEEHQALIKNILFNLNQAENDTALEVFFKYDNVSSFFNELQNIDSLNGKLRQNYADLVELKSRLEGQKSDAEAAKKDLKNLQQNLVDQKYIEQKSKTEKSSLLASTKSQESLYKKLYADRVAKKEALEKEVFDYESKLKFILDPNSLPPSGTGVFSWPLDNIRITQLFGATVAARRLYASGSHNGVDFAASIGTPVKAALDGEILGTGNTDITCPGASFGKWILIKHNNGLASIYAHLSLIKVNPGESVSTGQIIAYSGNTGYSTGPHLHVSVYARGGVQIQSRPSKVCGGRVYTMPLAPINAYLDPMLYFPS